MRAFVLASLFLVPITFAIACSSSGGGGGDIDSGSDDAADVQTTPKDGSQPDSDTRDSSVTDAGDTTLSDSGYDAASDANFDSAADAAQEASADATPDAAVDAGTPSVLFRGRVQTNSPTDVQLAWPGTSIVARFMGTTASVQLRDIGGFGGGPSSFEIYVDNTRISTLVLTPGIATYQVVAGLVNGPHTVELVKRTEANLGTVQFLGFTFAGGQLLPPPARPARLIEVLGDSSVDGYGVDGVNPCPGGASADTHNSTKSFGYLAAKALSSDLSLLGYSGKGFTYNEDPNDKILYPTLFLRTLPEDDNSMFPFAMSQAPDVVLSMVGGQDYSETMTPRATFQAKVTTFADTLRTKYPNALVVFAVGPQIKDDYPVGFNARTNMKTAFQNVVTTRAAGGDANMASYVFVESLPQQETGCYGHAGPGLHQQMANEIVPYLKQRLGW